MESSDAHLEATLEEMNAKVAELEGSGDPRALMEAYVNRGTVLAMLEYRTSAAEDFLEAADIADSLGDADAGTFVKIHVSLAMLEEDRGGDPVEEYAAAAGRLPELGPRSLHYDARSAVRMCASACRSLLDRGWPEECGAYIDKGLELARGVDPWSANRRLELMLLAAEAEEDMDRPEKALEFYDSAVDAATDLSAAEELEDVETVVLALVMRASVEADLSLDDREVADLRVAVDILEMSLEEGELPDREPLISLHHDLAGALMKTGRVDEAERHLVRAMEIGIGQSVGFEVHAPRDGGEGPLRPRPTAARTGLNRGTKMR